MILGNDERIALVIETQAKMEGLRQARAGMVDLGASVDRMSPKIRTAANAATTLAFSMQGAGGSAQSMAIAAGTLTSSLAGLATSARLAAAATGIGALVVVAASVAGWFRTAGAEAKKAGEEFQRALKGMVDAADVGKLSEAAAKDFAAVRLSEGRAARMKAELDAFKGSDRDKGSLGLQSAEMQRAIDKEEALTVKLRARYHATLAGVDIAVKEKVAQTESAISIDKWTKAQGRAVQAAEQALAARQRLIDAAEKELAVDRASAGSRVGSLETMKGPMDLMTAPVFAAVDLGPINVAGEAVLKFRDRLDLLRDSAGRAGAEVREVLEAEIKDLNKQFRFLARDMTVALAHGAAAALAGKNGKDVISQAMGDIFSRMGQSMIVTGATMLKLLPALSNPFTSGPAMIAAGIALSALGMKLGSAMAGGGRGGGGGGDSGNVGTFRPRGDGVAGGGQTVNIIVRDASGRDAIAETIYNLNRARSLNVSGLPPTRGLDIRVAGG